MSDLIEKYFNSTIQHGKENDRVYLMKLDTSKALQTLDYIIDLAHKNSYSKILTKIPAEYFEIFQKEGFIQEAFVPSFYKAQNDCVFASKFLDKNRQVLQNKEEINKVIKVCDSKKISLEPSLPENFSFGVLAKEDAKLISEAYKEVFETYPFPVFKEEYILKTMDENVCYFGIKKGDKLVSLSSSEMDKDNLNSEMTDFATLPEYRGYAFASYLLCQMEKDLIKRGFKTAYTIARSVSFGMNITFKKNGFIFSGTLVNNSNISGSIESMNIWYKSL